MNDAQMLAIMTAILSSKDTFRGELLHFVIDKAVEIMNKIDERWDEENKTYLKFEEMKNKFTSSTVVSTK